MAHSFGSFNSYSRQGAEGPEAIACAPDIVLDRGCPGNPFKLTHQDPSMCSFYVFRFPLFMTASPSQRYHTGITFRLYVIRGRIPKRTLSPSLPSLRPVLTPTRPTVKFKHSRLPYKAIPSELSELASPSTLNIPGFALPQILEYDSQMSIRPTI